MKVSFFLVAFWFTNVGVGGCGQLLFTFYISQKGIRSSLCCQVVSVSVYQCSAQFACVVLLTESYFNLTQYEPRADLRGSVLVARKYQFWIDREALVSIVACTSSIASMVKSR